MKVTVSVMLLCLTALFINVASADLAVTTDFPGGSANVVSSANGVIHIAPRVQSDRGWPCWWYLKVDGATSKQEIELRLSASEGEFRTGRRLPAAWSQPARAAISVDNITWTQTPQCQKESGVATYRFPAPAGSFWLAWGPPFLPSHADDLLTSLKSRLPQSQIFELAKTRGGRSVRGIRIGGEAEKGVDKFGVWIQARQHAWEAGSSWVGRGFAEWLASEDVAAQELRRMSTVYYVPIMDVDNVAMGAGGKEAIPRDHNRDWDDQPHYPEVAAAQKRILELNAAGQFDVFIDLHNPGGSERRPYFFGPINLGQLPAIQQRNHARWLAFCEASISGPLPLQSKYKFANYVRTDEERNRMSANWVRNHSDPHVLSTTLETAWNTSNSNQNGYAKVGAQLGMALSRYLVSQPRVQQEVVLNDESSEQKWKYSPDLLRPFWVGDRIESESMLFIRTSENDEAKASVLFPVTKVLSVHNSAGDVTYEEGRDYIWTPGSREITLPKSSRIVSRTPADLRRPAGSQKYKLTHRDGNGEIFFGGKLEYHDMQTCVTYTHKPEDWKTITPTFDEKKLPRTIQKLRDKKTVSIVLIGDSISSGCNASGWAGEAPFQPSFPGLLQLHLEACYQSNVRMTNPSVSGKDTRWVLSALDKVVEPKPDLVIVAFGMNDAAGRPAKEYQANTKAVIAKISGKLPDTEFILVATMLGNRDWTRLQQELFPQYRDALAELCEPGIALADMTSIWTEFLKRKQDWDLTGNGVNHPNDFGHRVYAQVLSTLLVGEWLPLFNGQDLTGWHKQNIRGQHGTGGNWGVNQDGVLFGEQDPPGSGNGGLLLSDEVFSEFEVELSLRPDWGPDSGVFVRTDEKGGGWQIYVDHHDNGNVGHIRLETKPYSVPFRPFGFSRIDTKKPPLKMIDDARTKKWPKGVYEQTCTREEWLAVWKPADWNQLRIRVTGGHLPVIEVWVNDLAVCHFDASKTTHPQYDPDRAQKVVQPAGSIGFQVHGGKNWKAGHRVFWKDIRVRRLK